MLRVAPDVVRQILWSKPLPAQRYHEYNKAWSSLPEPPEISHFPVITFPDEPNNVAAWFDFISYDKWVKLEDSLIDFCDDILEGKKPPQISLVGDVPCDNWFYVDEQNNARFVALDDLPEILVLDTETVYAPETTYRLPITAVAYGAGKYFYYHPSYSPHPTTSNNGTIKFPKSGRIVIGHNVSYDRKYLSSEYLMDSENYFIDTMSLGVACFGLSEGQQALYRQKHVSSYEDVGLIYNWKNHASEAALSKLYEFLFRESIDKGVRDKIIDEVWSEWAGHWYEYTQYCSEDVYHTARLFTRVFEEYSRLCSNPISWLGMMDLGRLFLPLDRKWAKFIISTDKIYVESRDNLRGMVERAALEAVNQEDAQGDESLRYLEWTVQRCKDEIKYKWFRKFKKGDFSYGMAEAVYCLKLRWDGHPIHREKKGISFTWVTDEGTPLPHPTKKGANINTPLCSDYLCHAESGRLSSGLDWFKPAEFIQGMDALVNWKQLQGRVKNVYYQYSPELKTFVAIPETISMGTQTRRIADKLWVVAANASEDRIGSECNQMIAAPEGYRLVGADVDGQELWIASMKADINVGKLAGCAWSNAVLSGSKALGTDIHSLAANMTGLKRNDAKNQIVFPIQYGAGTKSITESLANTLGLEGDDKDAMGFKIQSFINSWKGISTIHDYRTKQAHGDNFTGGVGSPLFNELEKGSVTPDVKTCILGVQIPDSLNCRYSYTMFHTTKRNWHIQSAGVDNIHCIIVAMDYYIKRLGIRARLAISRHDEVRYLVHENDVNIFGLALQNAHLRAMALPYYLNGFDTMPAGVMWYSEVDVDDRLRKSVTAKCITPSTPDGFPIVGYIYNINDVLDECKLRVAGLGGSLVGLVG